MFAYFRKAFGEERLQAYREKEFERERHREEPVNGNSGKFESITDRCGNRYRGLYTGDRRGRFR